MKNAIACRVAVVFLIVMGLMAAGGARAAAPSPLELMPLWTTDTKTFLESQASVADINGDGLDEIIAAGREELIALDGNGSELWRWRTKGRFMTYPAVLAVEKGPALLFAADYSGWMSCIDGAGVERWHAQLDGPSSWSASVAADLDGDGAFEVVQTDETGAVWAFRAESGEKIWKSALKGMPVSPAVADLDGDGKCEVIVCTNKGLLYALANDGSERWHATIGGESPTWATSAPVVFAASDGARQIVAASNDGRLYCFDASGRERWQRTTRGAAASGISVGDMDLDGRADVFVITQMGVVHRFDEDGAAMWEIDMQGRTLAAGALLDMDGDGSIEFAFSTQGGHLMVLDGHGGTRFDHQFDCRTINVTPAFGKLAAAKDCLSMIVAGGESGRLFGFKTPANPGTAIQWAAYRGNERKQGAWLDLASAGTTAMTPANLAPDRILIGEDILFRIRRPASETSVLTASAACERPDGARVSASTKIVGDTGVLPMAIQPFRAGVYRFTWQLANPDGLVLASGEREVSMLPFANDRALAARASEALESAAADLAAALPATVKALVREKTLLDAAMQSAFAIVDAAAGGGPKHEEEAFAAVSQLNRHAKRLLRVAATARQAAALGSSASLIAFEDAVWDSRNVDTLVPERAENPLKIARRAVPGEHEPVSLKLFNVTDRELVVRVLFKDVPDGLKIAAHEALATPTGVGRQSWDALPRLGPASVIRVPSLETRELWVDVDLGSAQPGDVAFTIRLQAINGAGVLDESGAAADVPAPETVVETAIEVLPFAMAPYGAVRLCTWADADGPQAADLLAHGNNVFPVGWGKPQFDADGALKGVDFSSLDSLLERLRGADVMLLLNGIPSFRAKLGEPGYAAEFKDFLERHLDHLAEFGFTAGQVALYPVDEPGGVGWDAVNQVVEFGKALKSVRPDILLYIDGGGELPMFEAMKPYVDIWTPGLHQLPEKTPEMAIQREPGKQLWSYNCGYPYARPIGTDLRNINVVAEYRAAALFAYRYGATGLGFWCYNRGPDAWQRMQIDYMIVYPGTDGPVTSRRWEGVREGIEDTRILMALKQRLADKDTPLPEDLQARIRRAADVTLAQWMDKSYEEMRLGLGRAAIDATNNDDAVNALRGELLDCAAAMTAFDKKPPS